VKYVWTRRRRSSRPSRRGPAPRARELCASARCWPRAILWQLRLPRAVLAFLVGGALASGRRPPGAGQESARPTRSSSALGWRRVGAVVAIRSISRTPGPCTCRVRRSGGAMAGVSPRPHRWGGSSTRGSCSWGRGRGCIRRGIRPPFVSLAEPRSCATLPVAVGGFSGASWTTVLVILGVRTLAAHRPRAAARPLDLRRAGRRSRAVPPARRATPQAGGVPLGVAPDRRRGGGGGRDWLCRLDRTARVSPPVGPAASHHCSDRVPRRRDLLTTADTWRAPWATARSSLWAS